MGSSSTCGGRGCPAGLATGTLNFSSNYAASPIPFCMFFFFFSVTFFVHGLHNFQVVTALMEDQMFFICICSNFYINTVHLPCNMDLRAQATLGL